MNNCSPTLKRNCFGIPVWVSDTKALASEIKVELPFRQAELMKTSRVLLRTTWNGTTQYLIP